MGKLVNVTGVELSSDMACVSTVEPFSIGDDLEAIFYDEDCSLDLPERLVKIEEAIFANPDLINGVIIDDNELGRHLFKRLKGKIQVVSSVKRPGSNLHWYWQPLDSFPEPRETITIVEQDVGDLNEVLGSLS